MTTPLPSDPTERSDGAARELERLRRRAFLARVGDVENLDRDLQRQVLESVQTFLAAAPERPRMLARAQLLQEVVLAFYDYTKFNEVGGEGLDGNDGPERRAIGQVSDAARSWASELLGAKMRER